MTVKLGPGLVDALVTWLGANFNTYLTAEQTLWNDGVVLEPMTEIVKRDPDQPERITTAPYLFVFTETSQIFDMRAVSMMSVHNLICWLVAQDPTAELLRTKIGRYGTALLKALNAYDTLGLAHRMAEPAPGTLPTIDMGMTLTNGSMAMNDVRVETHWTVKEE